MQGRWRTAVLVVCSVSAVVLVLLGRTTPAVADSGPQVAFSLRDTRITESSGLAASKRHHGVYWTHNDSDSGPYVYAVNSQGRTVATVRLRGVTPRDVEAISLGPNGQLYLGDIGDNQNGSWSEVWIYRFTEPKQLHDTTVPVTRYTVRYADGPRDAEALMMHPRTGRVYLASKNENGGGLYEGPSELSSRQVNTFHRIAEVPWVTDGAFSPDGSRLLLRGYFSASEYRWEHGRPQRLNQQPEVPMEPQGESVTFTADGQAAMFGSEGTNSEVWRVPLTGDLLPTSAASKDPTTSGTSGPPGSHSTGPGGLTVGGLVFAALAVLALVLRRGLRRRP